MGGRWVPALKTRRGAQTCRAYPKDGCPLRASHRRGLPRARGRSTDRERPPDRVSIVLAVAKPEGRLTGAERDQDAWGPRHSEREALGTGSCAERPDQVDARQVRNVPCATASSEPRWDNRASVSALAVSRGAGSEVAVQDVCGADFGHQCVGAARRTRGQVETPARGDALC